jgi:hypothetical protein
MTVQTSIQHDWRIVVESDGKPTVVEGFQTRIRQLQRRTISISARNAGRGWPFRPTAIAAFPGGRVSRSSAMAGIDLRFPPRIDPYRIADRRRPSACVAAIGR